MKVQVLNKKKHDRKSFDCGVDSLNTYLNNTARQHDNSDLSRTFVLTENESSDQILAYYSITTCHIYWDDIPENLQKDYPNNGISAALIGRLAVHKKEQRKGHGEFMVIDAIEKIIDSGSSVPHPAIVVDAIDDDAKRFYISFGFEEITPNSMRLFMPMRYAKDMLF